MPEKQHPLYQFGRFLVNNLTSRIWQVRAYAADQVPDQGGCIIACNHQSNLDPLVVGCAVTHRQIRFMAKRELFRFPPLAAILLTLECIPVDRHRKNPKVIMQAEQYLREGKIVGLFPEGTRSKGDILPWKPGVAILALKTGVPVVPAAVVNTRFLLEDRTSRQGVLGFLKDIFFTRHAHIYPVAAVKFGPPLQFPEGDPNDKELVLQVINSIRRRTVKLFEELKGLHPAQGNSEIATI